MMLCDKPQVGRPAGVKRQAFTQWACNHGQFTMGQLIRDLGWSTRDANNLIRRALARDQLRLVGRVSRPGCKRPVALYAPVATGAHTLAGALSGWVN